jgi:succinoglycan biosynthesis protein ExoO
VAGEVADVEPLFREAAVVLAPVQAGGGQQLKVIEALSYGRVVVATSFSARSVPSELSDLCVVADGEHEYAAAVVKQLTDSPSRWAREQRAETGVQALPTWRVAAQPAVAWMRNIR